ncbi:MAG: T9SS type A sorting domain-containing protein [Bacteroidota bacterium]
MKKYYTLMMALLIGVLGYAQGYEFGIQHNGGYNFSIVAIPDFDGTNTDISDIGFALMLPAGNADISNVSTFNGRLWGTTEFTAGQLTGLGLGDGTRDGFAMNLPPGQTILSHTNGVPFVIVTFDISNMPTSGALEILSNSDPIAMGLGGSIDSFFNSNIDSTTTQNYFSGIASGQGTFLFNILNTDDVDLSNIHLSIYPNPAKDQVIITTTSTLDRVALYDITGKLVNTYKTKTIDISGLNSGVYLMKIKVDDTTITKRLIKE